MRSNALKHDFAYDGAASSNNSNPRENPRDEQARLERIARAAREACDLQGNRQVVDFEEFLSQYGEGRASDFA